VLEIPFTMVPHLRGEELGVFSPYSLFGYSA